jgi:FG-GAP-like repeat
MESSNLCSSRLLIGVITFLSSILVPGTLAQAQAYLFNSSYIATGGNPLGAVVEDFNRDGRSDLASINYDNTVSIMLGKPGNVFGVPVKYAIGASPFAMIAADLRKNGHVDLITVNMPNGTDQPGTVSVLLGNGNGTFKTHVDYSVGDYPEGVVAGDFNDDGKVDLAIPNRFDNTVSILYGTGSGTFQPQVLVDVGSGPSSISSGDFNGDGRTDLIASCVGDGTVSVLLNDGAGSFTRADSSWGFSSPGRSLVVAGKFTSDGRVDAVISDPNSGQLYFLKGLGTGSFSSPTPILGTGAAVGAEIYTLIASDINKDGKTDLGVGSIAPSDEFSVLIGNGDGTFRAPVSSPIFAIESVALVDINGDGFLDLVTPEQGLSSIAVVLGNGKGQFGLPKTVNLSATANTPHATVAADFNGDGKLDLAVTETNFPNGQVAVSVGDGQGKFASPLISPLLSKAINNANLMRSGDFNGDGRPDLIIMDDYSTGFQVLLGNGNGTFQTPVDTNLNTTLNFGIGDFNGDGKTDVVVSTSLNAQTLISIYLSNGDGTFTLGKQYTELYGDPIVADVNKDGKLDLVFVGNPVFVMLGNGDGTFQKAITGPVVNPISLPIVEDFDGDGNPDIVVAPFNGVAFLKGNGDGTFQTPIYSDPTSLLGYEILAEDVNGDGKLDLVNVAGGEGVLVLLGRGDGTFGTTFSFGANGQVFSVNFAVGDFNSDGIGDIGLILSDVTSGKTVASLYLSTPTIALFPATINFGSITVGQTSPLVSVQVSSVGNKRLSLSSILLSGNFVEQNNCGKQLNIGGACTIKVQFKPLRKGTQVGTVKITDTALGTSQLIRLSGVGK